MEEFPVYLTFFATPGYDDSLRESYGIWFTLLFQLSGKNDVDLILEDTKRKSFNFDMMDYFFHAISYK